MEFDNIQRATPGAGPVPALPADPLHALGALGDALRPEDLFRSGLDLLERHLGADRALVACRDGRTLEYLWSAAGPVAGAREPALDPELTFCAQVLRRAGATLVIDDAAGDPEWQDHPALATLGVRAYIGAPLRRSGQVAGVLSVHCRAARAWEPAEVALVHVLASVFSHAMEVECLKAELEQARAILDLTSAVVEDQAMDDPQSGLPSRRYLEVWCRSNLVQARRRREVMAVVAWTLPARPGRDEALRLVGDALRGEDLLVDLGQDRFLLILPHTSRPGAEVVLARVRPHLGPAPVGATLWNPLLSPDREAPTLQPAIRRAQAAVSEGVDWSAPEGDDGKAVWSILEPSQATFLEEAGEW